MKSHLLYPTHPVLGQHEGGTEKAETPLKSQEVPCGSWLKLKQIHFS